ncbi:TrmH family RNA methyltransferase [Desulfolutivibrio sulfoxidireducens]|uniref:TrmH family RNA methyltransferase n=1 Tax=Desulfolutivibrio sulfoxidireducens TaxID=2773299 RepID=UPI00159DA1B6|nr:RNA methyltransferase [Desulfolutivibrio sulfoxidireducens]QLA16579.1 23S rRNA (guanosine(2251)-2'-O)-methyltransferase RlmB [Desulfolutivibrio sulfoxidireducens]QLA19539.1 23S rRNA (guanosine(2251)-2'-O)-methyltransferase RlmB [Desulfolutivibrio sulfoxidireducens]
MNPTQRHNASRFATTPDAAPGAPSSIPEDVTPGKKPVRELLAQSPGRIDAVVMRRDRHGRDMAEILDACRAAGVRFKFAPKEDLDRLCGGASHQGVVALLAAAPLAGLDEVIEAGRAAPLPVVLALDQVQDTGNVGALARTMYALGGGGLLVVRHEAARLGPGAARASAGALSRLPVHKAVNLSRALDTCVDQGLTVVCATDDPGAEDAFGARFPFPMVLVLGNEDKGIRSCVAKRCDLRLRIPFAREFDSLNVAQAGAIILGLAAAQRSREGR